MPGLSLALRPVRWGLGLVLDAILGAPEGPDHYVSPTTGERYW